MPQNDETAILSGNTRGKYYADSEDDLIYATPEEHVQDGTFPGFVNTGNCLFTSSLRLPRVVKQLKRAEFLSLHHIRRGILCSRGEYILSYSEIQQAGEMKLFCVGILAALCCCSLTECTLGIRRRQSRPSLFDDPFFYRPWATFDMMSKDFDDHFREDPFFDHDDFDEFFDRPFLPPSKKDCVTPEGKDANRDSSCQKVEKSEEKDTSIPKLVARVVKNDEKQFKFAMNLKGFNRKELSVKVEDDFLKISGKKSCKEESKKCSERSFFRYQYLLPKHTDLQRVKASFSKDGFLIVDVPKLHKIEDGNSGLEIEELNEVYVDKLTEGVKKDRKTNEAKPDENKKEDDDVTVEEVTP